MTKADKILKKALRNPAGLRFAEICSLAESFCFTLDRKKGSHKMYVREDLERPLDFQNVNGMAKRYQVEQLLDALREFGDIDD